MKRPSFQFYPGDWKSNAKLRRCSPAARGAWIDILCVLHDSEEYGVCRWPLSDLAQSAGVPMRLARELVDKNVLKGADSGAGPYVFTPSHAGKVGEPVTLVDAGNGCCWYSSRFVRDEWIRQRRGQSTQFSSEYQPPKDAPIPPIGERQGDGPSSSSSSSLTSTTVAKAAPPPCPHLEIIALYAKHLPACRQPDVTLWNGTRAKHLQARWREKPERQNLTWWDNKFFPWIAESDFLTGKVPPSPGHKQFELSMDWIVKADNFTKILEGKYR